MRRIAVLILFLALAVGTVGVRHTAIASPSTLVVAQAGSTGGAIGKRGKSASGVETRETPGRSAPIRKPRAAKESSDTASICRRIVGSWTWTAGKFPPLGVVFKSNGTGAATNGVTSKWTCDGGMYTIAWSNGYTDRVTVSSDGRRIAGNGYGGIRIAASRQ